MLREIGRALIASSPLAAALGEARRMARRYLQNGGAATAPGADRDRPVGFVVPPDIDEAAIIDAIGAKLRRPRSRSSAGASQQVLQRGKDGRLVVPVEMIRRLGDDDEDLGRQFLDTAVNDIRGRRVLMRIERPFC